MYICSGQHAGCSRIHQKLNQSFPVQASDTAELVEKLEDSQMTLGSMASNRYSTPFRWEQLRTERVSTVLYLQPMQECVRPQLRLCLCLLSGKLTHPGLPAAGMMSLAGL